MSLTPVFRQKKPFLPLNGRYLIARNNKDKIQLLDATPADSTFFYHIFKRLFFNGYVPTMQVKAGKLVQI